ncbi:MAG: 30S ribosomal protein S20 [Deltaproteobacteria bacterium]|jgi:small subunit ribosomal protein S20|nr:30S ribosomal protein S20 [Deltaproteobacteria bacterium]
MANIQSSAKKNRQRIKAEARNASQKSAMRTAVKKLRAAIATKDEKRTVALLKEATKLVARLGRRGIIKRRMASREISRLTRASNAGA